MKKPEELDDSDFMKAFKKKMFNESFQYSVCAQLTLEEEKENDFSRLTVQEIIEKIRDHIKQGPLDVNSIIFLRYLAYYPVSMCKREVSPFLKKLIAFHYGFGDPGEHEKTEHSIEPVSYDDLAEIFGRSKATISEYVNQFRNEWVAFQGEMEQAKAIEEEARRQLIEEEKQKLRQTNEGMTK